MTALFFSPSSYSSVSPVGPFYPVEGHWYGFTMVMVLQGAKGNGEFSSVHVVFASLAGCHGF